MRRPRKTGERGPKEPQLMLDIVQHSRLPMCVTDPHAPDNPIVFVNPAFTELTGYSEDEVIGRNCRFLQGPDTDPASIEKIRGVIARQSVESVEILNYRKDGSSYLNALQLGPIFDEDGDLVYFLGSQLDVTQERQIESQARVLAERELVHRLRNIVNVMTVIMRMTAREHDSVPGYSAHLVERLTALSTMHFASLDGMQTAYRLDDRLDQLLAAYAPAKGRQFALSGPEVTIPASLASPLSLALHELATNSVKHGALGAEGGRVLISWDIRDATLDLTWTERGGPSLSAPDRASGSTIVTAMISGSGGTLDFDWQEAGLVATISLPLGQGGSAEKA